MSIRFLWISVVLGLFVLNFTHKIYFNIYSHSLPSGIYIKIKGTPKMNDFAATCLTPSIAQYGIKQRYLAQGQCETGSVLVLKIIKGLPGDHFVINNGNLESNGASYPIMDHDSSGRILRVFYNQKEGILDKDKYLLISDFTKNSWDSRYWGPVSIQFLLKPFWLFEKGYSSPLK